MLKLLGRDERGRQSQPQVGRSRQSQPQVGQADKESASGGVKQTESASGGAKQSQPQVDVVKLCQARFSQKTVDKKDKCCPGGFGESFRACTEIHR